MKVGKILVSLRLMKEWSYACVNIFIVSQKLFKSLSDYTSVCLFLLCRCLFLFEKRIVYIFIFEGFGANEF